MAKAIRTKQSDPSWPLLIRQRKAVLWIGPEWMAVSGEQGGYQFLESLVLQPWLAVFLDGVKLPLPRLKAEHRFVGPLVLRVYDSDPGPEQLPPNRLPVYVLRGPEGTVGPGDASRPHELMVRFKMIERAPHNVTVFAIGADSREGYSGLTEAASIAPAFRNIVVLSSAPADLGALEGRTDRLVSWTTAYEGLLALLDAAAAAAPSEEEASVFIRHPSGGKTIHLSPCIDPSDPITESFALVPASAVLAETHAVPEELETFLADPTSSWSAYSSDIPFPRHSAYRESLMQALSHFPRDGTAASHTAWIPAEDGSGATTVLRHLAFM